MNIIKNSILEHKDLKKNIKSTPLFVPGGQSTQLIVGATPESDYKILNLSENLYNRFNLRRVYYSAYVPVVKDNKFLPDITHPPLVREHRLYQADWLLRFYGFKAKELIKNENDNLDLNFDSKTSWALSNIQNFPIEINKASYYTLLRIPGIGVRSAQKILITRKVHSLSFEDLKKLGIVLKRAKYFIICKGKYFGDVSFDKEKIETRLLYMDKTKLENESLKQLSFFNNIYPLSSNNILLLLSITTKQQLDFDFLSEITYSKTDLIKYAKVKDSIVTKIDSLALNKIYKLYLSNYKGKGILCYKYLKIAFKIGKGIHKYLLLDEVKELNLVKRRVSLEAHRFTGFVRFTPINDKFLYSSIEPDNNILEIISPHFVDRFNNEYWIIHDIRREIAVVYDKASWEIAEMNLDIYNSLKNYKDDFQKLWKDYFKSATIEERLNPKLQKRQIPKRYWSNLPEIKS